MHLSSAKRDLIDLLCDKVTKNGNSLTVLPIDIELATACVLMQSDERATIRLRHCAQSLLNDIYAGGENLVWVPEVDYVSDKF